MECDLARIRLLPSQLNFWKARPTLSHSPPPDQIRRCNEQKRTAVSLHFYFRIRQVRYFLLFAASTDIIGTSSRVISRMTTHHIEEIVPTLIS